VGKSPKPLDLLIERLGVSFRDKSLLDAALLHRSYSAKHRITRDNERLEFLGDSILNACVSDFLFRRFPERDEGELTKIRARLVSRKALKSWGCDIGLEEFVMLSDRMQEFLSSSRTHIIEDTMEAVIGALYIDRGFEATSEFINRHMEKQDFHRVVDFKSRLQEYTVEKFGVIPEYEVVSEEGLPHSRVFSVRVLVQGKEYGEGKGSSKKEAQQEAAGRAYEKLAGEDKEKKDD